MPKFDPRKLSRTDGRLINLCWFSSWQTQMAKICTQTNKNAVTEITLSQHTPQDRSHRQSTRLETEKNAQNRKDVHVPHEWKGWNYTQIKQCFRYNVFFNHKTDFKQGSAKDLTLTHLTISNSTSSGQKVTLEELLLSDFREQTV